MGKPTYTEPATAYTLGGPKSREAVPPCPKCGGSVDFTTDAIGRLRERCRRCDGVAPTPFARPGEVRRTQTIEIGAPVVRVAPPIALPAGVYRLPEIQLGQLRCQYCARGVEGKRTVCKACVAERRAAKAVPKKEKPAKLCRECGVVPLARRAGKFGRPPQRCADCQAKKDLGPVPTCWVCKGEAPRGHKKCDDCRAKTAANRQKKCTRCGSVDVPKWKQLCATCRTAGHAGTAGGPPRQASPDGRAYAEKQCARCFRPFTPTGPRSLYCERRECR